MRPIRFLEELVMAEEGVYAEKDGAAAKSSDSERRLQRRLTMTKRKRASAGVWTS